MFFAEVQYSIVLVEEVAFTDGLVTENAHVCSLEACQLELALGNLAGWILAEKGYSGIGQVAFCSAKVEVIQSLVYAA